MSSIMSRREFVLAAPTVAGLISTTGCSFIDYAALFTSKLSSNNPKVHSIKSVTHPVYGAGNLKNLHGIIHTQPLNVEDGRVASTYGMLQNIFDEYRFAFLAERGESIRWGLQPRIKPGEELRVEASSYYPSLRSKHDKVWRDLRTAQRHTSKCNGLVCNGKSLPIVMEGAYMIRVWPEFRHDVITEPFEKISFSLTARLVPGYKGRV